MDCSEAESLIDDLFDRDLNKADRRAVEQHIAECDVCAAHYERSLEIERWAAGLKAEMPSVDFVDRVMARVATEEPPTVEIERASRRLYLELIIAAAAAAALLSGAGSVYDWIGRSAVFLAQSIGSFVADVADGIMATGETLWRLMTESANPFSPSWLVVAAAMAFALMIAFNYAQARAAVRKK